MTLENELGELQTNAGVVNGRRDLTCTFSVSHQSIDSAIGTTIRIYPPVRRISHSHMAGSNSRSTKEINRPVLPPILLKALPKPFAAPLIAGPARLNPSLALLWMFFAASVAFSALVDSNLLAADRTTDCRDCRTSACTPRDEERAIDMVKGVVDDGEVLGGQSRDDAGY